MPDIKEGSYVHYNPEYGAPENGRVKSVGELTAFVVYHCNNEWSRYEDYTGQRTDLENLHLGWVDKDGKPFETPEQ